MYKFRLKNFSVPKVDIIEKLVKWKEDNWIKNFPSHWISPFYTPIFLDKEVRGNLVGVLEISEEPINVGVYLGKGGNLLQKRVKGRYTVYNSPFYDMEGVASYNEEDFKKDLLINLELRLRKINRSSISDNIKQKVVRSLLEEKEFINNLF